MKRRFILISLVILTLLFSTIVFATSMPTNNGYAFELNYTGEIKENVPKEGMTKLVGTEATPYSNVLIKIDLVSGPATPKILAKDTNGTEHNLAETGYWGPPNGFAVGGTFTNETPITATYPKAGKYVTKLSLIDVKNNNAVITSKEFTVEVLPANATENTENNIVDNTVNNTTNNEITEIPKTGTSIWQYVFWATVILASCAIISKYLVKSKE